MKLSHEIDLGLVWTGKEHWLVLYLPQPNIPRLLIKRCLIELEGSVRVGSRVLVSSFATVRASVGAGETREG